jgi:hypothetical protein
MRNDFVLYYVPTYYDYEVLYKPETTFVFEKANSFAVVFSNINNF